MLASLVTAALGCFAEVPELDDMSSSSGGPETSAATSDASSTAGSTDAIDETSADDATTVDATDASSSSSSSSSSSTSGDPGDTIVLGPLTPSEDLDDGALYPDGSGYSAHWYPSGEENAEGRQYLGQYPMSKRYYGYMRFQLPEALPPDAIVDSAVLEIAGHDEYQWNGAHALRVWVQDSADAPAVGGTFDYPQDGGTPLLPRSVRWPVMGGLVWQQPGPNATPELATLVQALVDANGGLAADAYVQFWIGEDVLDGIGAEVGWLDSIAGLESAPRLTIAFHLP